MSVRSCCNVSRRSNTQRVRKDFIPKGKAYGQARERARGVLLQVAEKMLGHAVDPDALLVGTSGRYEYRNKGWISTWKR